ncbi:hypothetical protein GcLGCM259_2305 [Glutamicibacter creatinolyticus]|jgi:hypothetical protein|uniref:DnaJ homologue subfamily C member 28 conserved domain-containing protein n=1 Tax=Glutamicibacter creatinolyticus TaxID=162496 RepID=A0A5B7WXZ3_9MICC|nr:DUF1992 domain-containing protein [Glutamicibacter creatinolyticus]QCY48013.1 hypothetical protein GcLGCM259_2305 [Glutamicibacter creatinolyticus]
MSNESKRPGEDASLNAARYQMQRSSEEALPEDEYARRAGRSDPQAKPRTPLQYHAEDEAWQVANSAIEEAMSRGEFDNLALAGQRIDHVTGDSDPDWWLKGLMKREQISGLGPPALTLRVEDQHLEQVLDQLPGEAGVREHLKDFNRRVIEARRQLQGGPPVITALRDVEEEVARWRDRRAARKPQQPSNEPAARRRWWQRRTDQPRP